VVPDTARFNYMVYCNTYMVYCNTYMVYCNTVKLILLLLLALCSRLIFKGQAFRENYLLY